MFIRTGPYVVGVATKRHVRLVLRPEHHEWDLIEQHPQLLDAVLLPESYVAPYPSGHSLEGHGEGKPPPKRNRGMRLIHDVTPNVRDSHQLIPIWLLRAMSN